MFPLIKSDVLYQAGYTPLIVAAVNGHHHIFKALLLSGASVDQTDNVSI